MAGIHQPSIQTVTAKVQLSQSSVLENIFLEDTLVCHGVGDMMNFMISQATQAQAVSQPRSYFATAACHGEISKKSFKKNMV